MSLLTDACIYQGTPVPCTCWCKGKERRLCCGHDASAWCTLSCQKHLSWGSLFFWWWTTRKKLRILFFSLDAYMHVFSWHFWQLCWSLSGPQLQIIVRSVRHQPFASTLLSKFPMSRWESAACRTASGRNHSVLQ